MSVEHRYTDETPSTDEQPQTESHSRSESTCQPQTFTVTGPGHTDDSSSTAPPLATRIERTQLRLQVAALECALETSERRRQLVIDRYERLLEEREGTSDEPSIDRSKSALDRLLGGWK